MRGKFQLNTFWCCFSGNICYHIGSVLGAALRRSRPCRRAVDRAAMRPDWDYFRQLAFGRKVAGDVPAISGVESEVCWTLTWIEHDGLPLELMSHKVERRNKVCISRDDGKRIGKDCRRRCRLLSSFAFNKREGPKPCGLRPCPASAEPCGWM